MSVWTADTSIGARAGATDARFDDAMRVPVAKLELMLMRAAIFTRMRKHAIKGRSSQLGFCWQGSRATTQQNWKGLPRALRTHKPPAADSTRLPPVFGTG